MYFTQKMMYMGVGCLLTLARLVTMNLSFVRQKGNVGTLTQAVILLLSMCFFGSGCAQFLEYGFYPNLYVKNYVPQRGIPQVNMSPNAYLADGEVQFFFRDLSSGWTRGGGVFMREERDKLRGSEYLPVGASLNSRKNKDMKYLKECANKVGATRVSLYSQYYTTHGTITRTYRESPKTSKTTHKGTIIGDPGRIQTYSGTSTTTTPGDIVTEQTPYSTAKAIHVALFLRKKDALEVYRRRR